MKRLIYIFIGLFVVTSCTKEIEIELDEGDQRLIVESWFTTEEKVHEVKLTLSSSYFDEATMPVATGASVKISGGGEEFIFTETFPGIYHSEPTAHASFKTEYTMEILYEGTTYTATDYCDTVPMMDDFIMWPEVEDGTIQNYIALIWSYEAPGYGDYYAWRLKLNGEYITDTLSQITFAADEFIGDGLYFEGWPIDNIRANDLTSGDIVNMEQNALSQKAYEAYIAIMSETDWRGGLFDAPPANVPSNFDNNAMGLFVVSSTNILEYTIP